MPEYLAPGVYVEEVSTGPKPIEGVSTSVAGIVGPTERGPEDIQYITSWLEYVRMYGGHLGVDRSFMSYGVQGFFDNGGKRCFIGRIVGNDTAGAAPLPASFAPDPSVTLYARGRGSWGNRVFFRIVPSSQRSKGVERAKDWFRIQVLYFADIGRNIVAADLVDPFSRSDPEKEKGKLRPDVVEDFDDLSRDPTAPNSFATVVNAGSRLIRIKVNSPPNLPVQANATDPFAPLSNGRGELPSALNDYLGALDPILQGDTEDLLGRGRGLSALDTVDGVSLLLAPDQVGTASFTLGSDLTAELVKRCEQLKDRFAVLSSPRGSDKATLKPSQDTTFGAQYYPWIWAYDPVTRDDQLLPPAGHVAGIIARTDIEQGVFKAPANAVVVGAKDLEMPVPKADQDLLNPVGINCIRDFRSDGRGIRLWGARTMSSDPEWKYVNVRRLFLYLEESIDEGTQWVVFEPNTEVTWGRVQRSIRNFLTTVWRNGGLFGTKPEEAFFVRCDRTTMSEDDIENGRLVCYIGVCPVRPAEFVIFRIGQKTADAVA